MADPDARPSGRSLLARRRRLRDARRASALHRPAPRSNCSRPKSPSSLAPVAQRAPGHAGGTRGHHHATAREGTGRPLSRRRYARGPAGIARHRHARDPGAVASLLQLRSPRGSARRLTGVLAGIAIAMAITIVGAPALARRRPLPASDDGRSLAVLPLTNLSADSGQDYFSDGLSEEILGAVSRIPGLRVAAHTSSFALKGTKLPVGEIGQKLGVRHVLEGSVQREGTRRPRPRPPGGRELRLPGVGREVRQAGEQPLRARGRGGRRHRRRDHHASRRARHRGAACRGRHPRRCRTRCLPQGAAGPPPAQRRGRPHAGDRPVPGRSRV